MSTSQGYRNWATTWAHDVSPSYERLALGIAADPAVEALIDELPPLKRQPNLVFTSARFVGAPTQDWTEFRGWLVEHWPAVRDVALSRSTQTNEAGRCATLLPLLARIEGPIALLEVGASAGLCLYPDRYSYRYRTSSGPVALDPSHGVSRVILTCDAVGETPTRLPDVVWRAGLDLNPLDVSSADDRTWLEALVWPEHEDRRRTLRAASAVAAADPPHIARGDLVDDLAALAATAPVAATLVVFHSAVLMYVPPERAQQFVSLVQRLDCTWISNEDQAVLPDIAALLPAGADAMGRFIVARDGIPQAIANGHGRSYEAL